jgi:hypothetical protein
MASLRHQSIRRWVWWLLALMTALVLAFCCFLAYGLRFNADTDQAVNELLAQDLVSPAPLLVPPSPAQVGTVWLPAPKELAVASDPPDPDPHMKGWGPCQTLLRQNRRSETRWPARARAANDQAFQR